MVAIVRPWLRPTTEADGFPMGLMFPVVLALMVPFKLLVLPLMAGPHQGLTVVHISAHHKRLLWDTLGGP